jgi:hypothetical protein
LSMKMRKMPKRYGAWATIHKYASKHQELKGSKGPIRATVV